MYADILDVRFIKWVDENNIVVDEENGFRRNRSCLEHIYALYTIINKRKQQKQSTYVCFVHAKKPLILSSETVCGINLRF